MYLPEVERTVGLFINTLPLRLALPPGQRVTDWLRDVQARQTELSDYQYSPLPAVQRWAELPAGTPLFESIVAFENYPAEMTALADIAGTIRIADVRPTERTNYPLTLQVAVGAQLSLRLIWPSACHSKRTRPVGMSISCISVSISVSPSYVTGW